jgi:AcrR family transcriptional regulator
MEFNMAKNAKDVLKEIGLKMVLEKGFKAVKVQDICDTAELSKMTFYYYYKNKYEIFEDILTSWFEELLDESKSIMTNEYLPFHERAMKLVEWKAHFVKTMSPAFLKELYAPDGKYMYLLKDLIQETQQLSHQFFALGKEQGALNPNVDIDTIMLWMNIVSDMLIEGKFTHLFNDPEEMNKQIRELMLYGLMGNVK